MGFNCPRLHGLRRLDLGVLCLLGLMREGSQGIIRWELNGSENGGFGLQIASLEYFKETSYDKPYGFRGSMDWLMQQLEGNNDS